MIEKFNGIFYLILFIIHFIGFGMYSYQMIIGNQKFRAKFEIDETAATIMRMTGAIFLGSFLMAIKNDPRKIAPVILMIVAAVSSISNFALNF